VPKLPLKAHTYGDDSFDADDPWGHSSWSATVNSSTSSQPRVSRQATVLVLGDDADRPALGAAFEATPSE
jgi:hypothetical protein